jgi:hypothetical protein
MVSLSKEWNCSSSDWMWKSSSLKIGECGATGAGAGQKKAEREW